jgi:predicted O-methyltransferase YrrM
LDNTIQIFFYIQHINKDFSMSTDIQDYINKYVKYPHPHLETIDQENIHREDISPNIGREVASLIDLLIRAIQAKNVLEFGTCVGFSTVTLANALRKTGGHLTAIEIHPRLIEETRVNLEKADLRALVTLICGDANQVLHNLEGPFDLILQDSDKPLYPQMVDKCVDLLRVGGLLAADDTLFPAMPIPEKYKPVIDEYNQRVFNHPKLISTILPIGDGLSISLKIL